MAIQGILYDLDGVLIDSAQAWFRVILRGRESCGLPPVTYEAFKPTFGQGIEADRAEFFPDWTAAQLQAFYDQTFIEELSAIEVMSGALDLLRDLHAVGLRQAVVTNTPRELAQCILKDKGFSPYLDTLAAAGETTEKPAPDLIWLALKRLELDIPDVLYVGDSSVDVAACQAAGVRMVGLRIAGDITLNDLSELKRIANGGVSL